MKENTFKYIFYAILIILIGLSIYFLYKDGNNKTLAIEEKNVELNILKEINIGIVGYDTINPILSTNRDVQYIGKLIFEPLVDITKDFKKEEKLAKEISKINATTYIIKLNEDIKFHDNSTFTAEDVIFTINNLKNENINSIYKVNVENIKEIEKIDEYTIKIILEEEIPFFEYNLCFPIISSNSYKENDETSIPNGTGKYKINNIEENKIELVLLEEKSKAHIKKINIILEKSTSDLYNDFSKENLDYIITENINYENYMGTIGYNTNIIPGREFNYLVLNCKNRFLKDKEIRQAINLSIDKNLINYNVFNNKYNICDFPLYNVGVGVHDDSKNKAKQNVGADSHIDPKNRNIQLNLIVNKENQNRCKVAEQIKEDLEKIGIKINIIKVNNYSYKNYLKNKNYDIILTGNIVSNSPNLETYFGEENLSNFKNEKVEEVLKDINNMGESEVLKEKYKELYSIYTEEMPFISLYSNSLFILTNKQIKGDMSCNWYNLFYNIDNWYKIQ